MTRGRHAHAHARDSGRGRWGVAVAVVAVVAVLGGGAALVTATTAGRDDTAGAQDSTPSARLTEQPAGSSTPSVEPTLPTATPSRPPKPLRIREAAPMVASEPTRLAIPRLDVESDVMDLGLTGQGVLEVPQGAFPAGWYTGSPTPGELGPAVIAGHVAWNGDNGVFKRLHELTPGDHVLVTRADGSTADFTVTEIEQYAKDAFPTTTVYGDIDHAGIRLITCGGLDPDSGKYEDNVVVYASLTG